MKQSKGSKARADERALLRSLFGIAVTLIPALLIAILRDESFSEREDLRNQKSLGCKSKYQQEWITDIEFEDVKKS